MVAPQREIEDDTGTRWRVAVGAYGPNHCLGFDSVNESRCLSPYPSNWPELSSRALLELLSRADRIWSREAR